MLEEFGAPVWLGTGKKAAVFETRRDFRRVLFRVSRTFAFQNLHVDYGGDLAGRSLDFFPYGPCVVEVRADLLLRT